MTRSLPRHHALAAYWVSARAGSSIMRNEPTTHPADGGGEGDLTVGLDGPLALLGDSLSAFTRRFTSGWPSTTPYANHSTNPQRRLQKQVHRGYMKSSSLSMNPFCAFKFKFGL